MLKCYERISTKFVKSLKEGLYELRVEVEGIIYRVFFIFDEGNIVVLFHGFKKKTQKTPIKEIEKAIKIKKNTMPTNSNLNNYDIILDERYGKPGTSEREQFRREAYAFCLGQE